MGGCRHHVDVMWSGVVLCRQVWTRWTWMVWTEGLQHLVPSIPVPAHTWMALEGVHQVITGVDTDACMWAHPFCRKKKLRN